MGHEPELGHDLAHFFRDKAHEVYDVPRVAHELLPELGVLRGDAHRAGVKMANAHHYASEDDERGRGEAQLLRPQKGRYDDIPPCLHLAVRFEDHPAP